MRYTLSVFGIILAAACSSQAIAQDDHVLAVQAADRTPAGISTTVGVRVPLGTSQRDERRTTFNITTTYGQRFESVRPLEIDQVRRFELAQVNFDGDGARDLQVGNLSLTQFGRDDVEGAQMNLNTGETILVVAGVVVVGVALAFLAWEGEEWSWEE